MSINTENYELIKEINKFTTSYLTFFQNGGHNGTFSKTLINKIVALSIKVKENRDYVDNILGYDIPSDSQECLIADEIMDGTYVHDRLFDVIERLYT